MAKITEAFKLKYDNIFAKLMNITVDELHFDKLKLNESICANDNAWQKHVTPDSICKQMVDLYSFNESDKILVLFNLELIKELISRKIKKENIYFVSDYHTKSDFLSKYFKEINYINLSEYTLNDLEEKIKSFNVKKFDVVFSNPPYGSKGNYLDLNILNNIFKFSNKIIFIHPAGYLLDNKFKTKICNTVRNTNYLEKTLFFWGNELFNINLFSPICISIWNINKKDNMCEVVDTALTKSTYKTEINKISIHGQQANAYEFFEYIKNYIKNHNGSIQDNITNPNNLNDFSIRFALIRGGCTKGVNPNVNFWGHFESVFGKDYNNYKCDHTFRFNEKSHIAIFPHWSFNNENEREHFINYCKTKIARFCLSFYKNTANIGGGELEIIPWLDFSREWTDKDLCEEFKISKELWEYIDNFIPDYYDDYKSGF